MMVMTRLLKCYGYCNDKYPKEELKKLNLNKNSSNPGKTIVKTVMTERLKNTTIGMIYIYSFRKHTT